MAKIDLYDFGGGGVNIVKNPLEQADNELVSAQNAELMPDRDNGGQGSLSKRGGIQALTSALAGAVTGMMSLPLQTTYTRTLYASLQEADSDTWLRTTNGSTWTTTTSPLQADDTDNHPLDIPYAGQFRIASIANKLIYPGAAHTTDAATPANNTAPPLAMWDGSVAASLLSLYAGPSSDGNYPFTITDMLVTNNTIYLSLWESPNSGEKKGRVLSCDLNTGVIAQIANAFGTSPHVTGGFPNCLAYYQGQLFVGLNNGSAANKVVRCYPGVDTTWTTDISTLAASGWVPAALAEFKGDLYMGVRGLAGTSTARVLKRTASTGAWASVDAGSEINVCIYTSLIVYNSELYAVLYEDGPGAADNCLIRKTSDGTTWSTDRNVEASDGWTVSMFPGAALEFNSDLFFTFKSTTKTATDGFILRRSAGSYTKPATDNIGGFLGVLVERT